MSPRARGEIVRLRRSSGVVARPLNFPVRRWLMKASIPPPVAFRIFWPVKRTVTRLARGGICGFLLFVSVTALGSAPNLKVVDVPPDVFKRTAWKRAASAVW